MLRYLIKHMLLSMIIRVLLASVPDMRIVNVVKVSYIFCVIIAQLDWSADLNIEQ